MDSHESRLRFSHSKSYFDQSILFRCLIGLLFGVGLFFFFQLKGASLSWELMPLCGTLIMSGVFVFLGAFYLWENHEEIFASNRRLALLGTILLLTLAIAQASEFFFFAHAQERLVFWRFPLFVPFAAIMISSLIGQRLAIFGAGFLTLACLLGLNVEPVSFSVTNLLASMVAILYARRLRKRKDIFFIAASAYFVAIIVILAFNLLDGTVVSFLFVADLFSSFTFFALTSIVAIGLLPIFETSFRIMTDITLMEYLDPSHELLKRLTIEAPGTYQHSMVVGSLSEAAANAVGANGLFCRVASQYHDVGKLANPQYFTENQLSGVDMHQLLTPSESAQVIIAHVSEGVAMARKVGLPEQFIDIIKEHHGTTLVYYFYHKQLEVVDGDAELVNKEEFRYSGPKPSSKESTIIMIADTLEAASRSLDEFSQESIEELVETLVARKATDGQFDNSLLTFEELGLVKQTMVKNLLVASHPRIKYPPHHPGEEG